MADRFGEAVLRTPSPPSPIAIPRCGSIVTTFSAPCSMKSAQRTVVHATSLTGRRSTSSALRSLPVQRCALLSSSYSVSHNRVQPAQQRYLSTNSQWGAAGAANLFGAPSNSSAPTSYFQRPSLPANTIIRFVPQQTAWIVERMGKFNRILEPGIAFLLPVLDRIAYVKSLKEAAIEIPSQSAITADNVTLELDGVLYTRVFDAYKAR